MPDQCRASPCWGTRYAQELKTAAALQPDLANKGKRGEQQDASLVFTLHFPSAVPPKLLAKQMDLPAAAHT